MSLVLEEKSLNKNRSSRSIRMGDIDNDFKYKMNDVPGFKKLRLCFQCGSCTADCPIARFSDIYHPRKLMRMTQLGMKDRVLISDALWLCAACFTCVDHCPQGVDIAGVLRALRNMAVEEGIIPQVFKELTKNILNTGYAYRIPELRKKKRMKRGLPKLPKSNVGDINKLFTLLGVSSVVNREKQ
jgi:heterodisulfide reductase subunit C